MSRICELWLKGTVENSGPKAYDALYRTNWAEDTPVLVATTITGTGPNGSKYWRDQYGQRIGTTAAWHNTPITYLKNCVGAGVNTDQPFDCLNGGCIPKITYDTPGFYANLAACESGCAKNSNCRGICVSPEEMAKLEQAANQLQSRICK